jgi:hypothetical protein
MASWLLQEPFPVTARDLAYGEQQVQNMIHDRPEMACCTNRRSPFRQWCVRQFAGSSCGAHVAWVNSQPEAASNGADDQIPKAGRPGNIRLATTVRGTDGINHPASCAELWLRTTFELNNLSCSQGFRRVFQDALDGRLSKEQWIAQTTRIEYTALVKTVLVYKHLWCADVSTQAPRLSPWPGMDLPATYEGWIGRYTDRTGYPWSSWGHAYDTLVVPYLKRVAKWPIQPATDK